MAYGDSPADSLVAVRAAIAAALNAQSYSVAGRSKAMASVRELRELEKELIEQASNSGSMCSIGLMVGDRRP